MSEDIRPATAGPTTPGTRASDPVALVIPGRPRDLGGFAVRRVLPFAKRRMVGPFVFLDHMGPTNFAPGQGLDVRPHPHIGLATVTYLFRGEILHRDSLGSVQPIRPGDVNWMTAGRGIVHSERTAPERRRCGDTLDGIQAWVALPLRHEETDPAFVHHPAASLPTIAGEGKTVRLIAGSLFGARSPVATLSELFYAEAVLAPGARLALPAKPSDRAVYVAEGSVTLAGTSYAAGQLVVLRRGADAAMAADDEARVMLLGGEPVDGERHIWWNFVASTTERIDQAKADWKAQRFPVIPGESEPIPLPE